MDSFSKRRNIIILIFVVVGVIFTIKLFMLQVVDKTYKRIATNNILKEMVDYPTRGLIYDRNGELLVYNEASYDLMATPREIEVFDTTLLLELTGASIDELERNLTKAKQHSSYLPSPAIKQVPPQRYALLKEKMYLFPGFFFQTRTVRNYKHEIAAHVLGYVNEVSDYHVRKNSYYKPGDYIGETGIEKAYENYLRGEKGRKYLTKDVHNRQLGSYQSGKLDTGAIKGKDLISTLDYKLQEYGELLMQNKAGSIVAIEPSTGEILAMVTTPNYSPMELIGRARRTGYQKLATDTLRPLFNRAIQAQYPPGSTLKMMQALIALQEGVITPRTRFVCNHGYHVGSFTQGCHHDAEFTLTPSIAQSCNAYYAYTFRYILEAPKFGGVENGYKVWRNHVLSFGFGDIVAPELSEETKGFVPTAEYYKKRVFPHSRWRALPIISLAIGQGEIQTTPIQMANYTACLANRGYYYTPHLVKHIEDNEISESFKEKHYTSIDTVQFEKIIDGMENVMSYNHLGTARYSSVPGLSICGKTGTAENPHGAEHSTFVAFAPRENPVIAVSVYVENGKWGTLYAAPIATLLIEKYINGEISESRKHTETEMINVNLLYPQKLNYIKHEAD